MLLENESTMSLFFLHKNELEIIFTMKKGYIMIFISTSYSAYFIFIFIYFVLNIFLILSFTI
jgi:hypothetical protein